MMKLRMHFPTSRLSVLVFIFCILFFSVTVQSQERKDSRPVKKETVEKENKKTKEKGKETKKADKKSGGENTGLPTRVYDEDDFRPQVEEESYGWLVFKTILVLGSIIGGFYYFFRFVTKKGGIQILGQDVINVLSVVPLGQNKYIQVVDLAGKILVLGITDSNINVITEIVDRDEMDRIRLLSSKGPIQREGGFQEYLRNQIGKVVEKVNEKRDKKQNYSNYNESEVDLDYLKNQRKRLKNLNGENDE